MKLFCPECRATFVGDLATCPNDGSKLFQVESNADPLVGAIIDERFRIDWQLGAGGMGTVYRGIQLSVNREVAIKVLRAELADKEIALERFFREARLISELTHPNIVRLIEFGQDRKLDLLYLVMELVRGTNLADLLRRGRFRVNFALEVIYQICGALTEPHARGIIHRDLKPDNLLLTPVSDGTLSVKVLDFGIARVLETNTQLTGAGMICGTPAYMAPEQAQNFELDARTDLYALGVILYEMLSGVPPFVGASSLQIMLKHIQEFARPLKEILPPGALPDDVEDLVHALIAKNPRDRLESARQVRDVIDDIRRAHRLEPVRFEADAGEGNRLYDPWLLPRLPSGSHIKSGPTEALRRETGLELSMGLSSLRDPASSEADTNLMPPRGALTLPRAPFGSDASAPQDRGPERATRQGGARAWTPAPGAAASGSASPRPRATMLEEAGPAQVAVAAASHSETGLHSVVTPRRRSTAVVAAAIAASLVVAAVALAGYHWHDRADDGQGAHEPGPGAQEAAPPSGAPAGIEVAEARAEAFVARANAEAFAAHARAEAVVAGTLIAFTATTSATHAQIAAKAAAPATTSTTTTERRPAAAKSGRRPSAATDPVPVTPPPTTAETTPQPASDDGARGRTIEDALRGLRRGE